MRKAFFVEASVASGLYGLVIYIIAGLFGCVSFYLGFAACDRKSIFLGCALVGLGFLMFMLGTLILAKWI